MRRIITIFAAALLCLPAAAQVQIGKSVQIGGGSGQGAGTVGTGTAGQIAQYPSDGNTVQGATMNGDGTISSGGAFTLSTANSSPGTCGDATHFAEFVVNGKGLTTSCTPHSFPSAGIQSINSATGPAITFACAAGLSCVTSGNTITISLATAFTINSFTGCGGSLELGQTVTNPTCAATYSATPTSASITNTDSIDSPLTLTTPFTSGTIVGSFVHTATATTTVTLTAIGASTQTATQTYTWKPAIFAGLGTAGATSSVTASGTTAVLSTGTVLPRAQLGAETVGETFGPFAPSAQVIYLLLTGGSHTFTDVCSGFPLPFNAPISVSFVNQYGVTVPEFLYQTTNVLTGSCFEPRIAS